MRANDEQRPDDDVSGALANAFNDAACPTIDEPHPVDDMSGELVGAFDSEARRTMKVIPTPIPDVLLLAPEVHADERGFFMETWRHGALDEYGIDVEFVQDNFSRSATGVLRGLHYQLRQPQGKLVRVTRGEIFDVAVDLRRTSPSFGQWVGQRLSADDKRALWIPPGFCHGFYVSSGPADVHYKCTAYYVQDNDRCILWNDPELGIEWPLHGSPLLSEKDRQATPFASAEYYP